jgi:hypothetical protein
VASLCLFKIVWPSLYIISLFNLTNSMMTFSEGQGTFRRQGSMGTSMSLEACPEGFLGCSPSSIPIFLPPTHQQVATLLCHAHPTLMLHYRPKAMGPSDQGLKPLKSSAKMHYSSL